MQQSDVEFAQMREIIVTGSYKPFKPRACYVRGQVTVEIEDCSWRLERLNQWSEVRWQQGRRWHWPARRKKCVGFTVKCPPELHFLNGTLLTDVLDSVRRSEGPHVFGGYEKLFYELAKGIRLEPLRVTE